MKEVFLEAFNGDLKLGDLKREYSVVFDDIRDQISGHKQYKHMIAVVDAYLDYKETFSYVPAEREQWKLDPIHLINLIASEGILEDDAYTRLEYFPLGQRKRKVLTKAAYNKAVKARDMIMANIGQSGNTFDYWQAVRDRLLPESFEYMGKTFKAVGRGAYPYECIMKDEHPNAMIYKSETGSWCTEFDRQVQTAKK